MGNECDAAQAQIQAAAAQHAEQAARLCSERDAALAQKEEAMTHGYAAMDMVVSFAGGLAPGGG